MKVEELGGLITKQRGNMGVRAAAGEIGISPSTLTRIEKGHVPDIGTLEKICGWLEVEMSEFTGIKNLQIAFKNKKAVPKETARSLAELIQRCSEQFAEHIDARGH